MCGIVGYVGAWNAAPVLLSGLSRLEYRGYDSAGIAVSDLRDGENRIEILKAKGRLQALKEMTDNGKAVSGTCGIGHTRWATHGEPSVANAHPHCSKDKRIVVVHNGIIENYKELKEYLQKKGFVFLSETDTEVVAHLLDYYYKGNPLEAIARALGRIRGSYALGILFQRPTAGKIYGAKDSSADYRPVGEWKLHRFRRTSNSEIYEKRLLHFRYGDRRVNQKIPSLSTTWTRRSWKKSSGPWSGMRNPQKKAVLSILC